MGDQKWARKSRKSQPRLPLVTCSWQGLPSRPRARGHGAQAPSTVLSISARSGECHGEAYTCPRTRGAARPALPTVLRTTPRGSIFEGVATVGRYLFTTATVAAMFGLTTGIRAPLGEKVDDPLNGLTEGCSRGLTLGARAHDHGGTTTACVYGVSPAAALLTMGQLQGCELSEKPRV
ncbi:NADH dehydrogenase [ubiquinone] 1 alpha subcomplex subunit 11-like [Cynocephalus volans]|uniref:NADH dehydrogenase [ubiquinone] 1 alpha subcomplex subunit 11-like n=1 Tax=Cynocephalus volans TaxID=110931 RepID=UPI002FCC4B46